MTTGPSLRVLLHSAAELLELIQGSTRPADREMDLYFRSHGQLGRQDRGAVADAVYGCLRHLRSLEFKAGSAEPRPLVAAWLLTLGGVSARRLEQEAGYGRAPTIAAHIHASRLEEAPLAVRLDVPDWFVECAPEPERLSTLATALAHPAPLDLRVNTLRGDREEAAARLAAEGFPAALTPYAPSGLRRTTHSPIFRTKTFQDGWVEVQDEGSQIVSLVVEPRRHECVVDFCAGAGGKTLHLGALMNNSGMLYAFDTAAFRLDRARERARRAGLSNLRQQVLTSERDIRLQRLEGKADRVLVDAPCSGSGTWRRNPDMKWRMDLAAVQRLAQDQQQILAAAARLVKTGGRLVYATCSLLAEENEHIIGNFLAEHGEFSVESVCGILGRRSVVIETTDSFLRLRPDIHGTDGFFVAALTRNT